MNLLFLNIKFNASEEGEKLVAIGNWATDLVDSEDVIISYRIAVIFVGIKNYNSASDPEIERYIQTCLLTLNTQNLSQSRISMKLSGV